MNIRFSGEGGQGIVLAGVILGSAVVAAGKIALQTQSYGSEARGGECKSDVIISEQEVYELEPTELDVLVALCQRAFNKYIHMLKAGGILVVDADLVTDLTAVVSNNMQYNIYKIRATAIATELGLKRAANMVILGYLTALLNLVPKQIMIATIKRYLPKGTEKLNLKAFELGFEQGVTNRCESLK